MKAAVAFLATLLGVMAIGILLQQRTTIPTTPESSASLRTAKVKRGDLLATIDATGTVEPEEVVDVGAQVFGRVESLGDPANPHQKTIDYGAVVDEGTVLAKLDDATYKSQCEYAEATLARAKADFDQAKARFVQASDDLERANSLKPMKAIADSDYDAITANHKTAQAAVESCKAVIRQNEALLKLAQANLQNTVVKSPVRGIIIDHHASVGRTVQASPGGPGLFVIAKNLRRMRVCASVNESDIGHIHVGIPVNFTVDAYPDEVFHGKVTQVRLNAAVMQNMVSYTVVVSADNPDGKLLPHLTARLRFELDQKRNVLLVPSTALRWRPRLQQVPPDVRDSLDSPGKLVEPGEDAAVASLISENKRAAALARGRDEGSNLWIDEGPFVRPVKVRTGASDGTMTEVSGTGLREGMEVVTGDANGDQETEEGRSSAVRSSEPAEGKRTRSDMALLSLRIDKRYLLP